MPIRHRLSWILRSLGFSLILAVPCAQADEWTIPEPVTSNRAFSMTNKRSANFYTQTRANDHPEHTWFRGFHIAGRRIFSDMNLSVDGKTLDPRSAAITATPWSLTRAYPNGTTETIELFDQHDLIRIRIEGPTPSVVLLGDRLRRVDNNTYVATQEDGATDYVAVRTTSDEILIGVDQSAARANQLVNEATPYADRWQRERIERITSEANWKLSDSAELNQSLNWISATLDSLITNQRGAGIYAGLPWFPEYWGRDQFISLRGATLVKGDFETAKSILVAFAKFQDLDEESKFYGRMPNIVKPGSIDYHTTDGTPRFVTSLRDYVNYSGDTALATQLFPNVRASIEGSIRNWTDAHGYLTHAENETWMDARREPDKRAYSARANRANDIQALWYEQLKAGALFARLNDEIQLAGQWERRADQLAKEFLRDFVDPHSGLVADHLNEDNSPDHQLRPNALFVLDLLEDGDADRQIKTSWSQLVYPWGVATLDAGDAFFHPYHVAPGRWHKDAAYHNGTVWPWLNGIAMQRMIEVGETEKAWSLFKYGNQLARERGGIGALPETMDAYPHRTEAAPRLTGTFLQAWSNAEHLRVWSENFLGIQPKLSENRIRLAPRIPNELQQIDVIRKIGGGQIHLTFRRNAGTETYQYAIDGIRTEIEIDIPPFAEVVVPSAPHIKVMHNGTELTVIDGSGSQVLRPDSTRVERMEKRKQMFRDVDFARPQEDVMDRDPVSPLPALSKNQQSHDTQSTPSLQH